MRTSCWVIEHSWAEGPGKTLRRMKTKQYPCDCASQRTLCHASHLWGKDSKHPLHLMYVVLNTGHTRTVKTSQYLGAVRGAVYSIETVHGQTHWCSWHNITWTVRISTAVVRFKFQFWETYPFKCLVTLLRVLLLQHRVCINSLLLQLQGNLVGDFMSKCLKWIISSA